MNKPMKKKEAFQVPGGTNFLIRIQYEQHHTWQGRIQWLESGKTMSFRSMLELIHLMENAIEIHAGEEWEKQFRHWDNKEEMG